MPIERDLRGYGRARPDIVWPNGARVAVSLVVNFEEGAELAVEQGDAETEHYGEVASTSPPGVRDLVQEQVFDYGMRAGLWRFLDAFTEAGIRSTFMMCGRAVERVPDLARTVVEAGHEPAVHGWRWLPHALYGHAETERRDIEKTRDVIARATGLTPVGFMSRGSQSAWTRDVLIGLGFAYDSNALDDDLPYWSRSPQGAMLVLPYGFDTNDMKFFHPNGFVQPEDFSNYVSAALATLVEEAERGRSAMLSVGFHLRICGRPARFRAVKTILAELARLEGRVWVATRAEIAAHFRRVVR
ncbi:peptidoglycan/xylan/chitin deacetylase (PgdA/CDA1 family) [Bradyrhizobium sp. R2.2-H]|jgi:peptidoglycan/xylan/chitin deacetylase (PgdA/CDA1 family)|uniref:polysaccharide deacetylase family protein n=1 Tax=unclassified Bradyrhizobium TaxID=2631580 RepID=UPI0010538E15|nr:MULTISPECIES: polysaccharide deacetylase family protein [unclassified Bradyrhizobium]TCU73842.1 peptidoglycan/xylan/chitin deacetylase (PgdA/CDA1 family) [Bradyrhizobium sp. Y-H1]TCU75968.1 peptidoglycan/xylan/chitin deacetylase (PgdA/CDA1 family) [Bradyrhizobium sp. R2.2-H]